jgi:Interleukin-like EMT inducer/6-pyruvoyl-tetrahydropterin synthase related domain
MRRAHLPVLLLMVGLVALYSWPLVTDLPHLYPDNPDARVLTWAMITAFRNLLTHPGALMQGNAFYPVGLSLTFSEPLFTPALVAGPIHAATGNPVFAYNVTLILFWAISGWAMYAVAIRVTRDRVAALLAAVVFMLCPYRTDMYIEFNMEMTFGIPLAFYTLARFLESQRPRDLALFCLVFWLQAISVLYYAVIVGFGLGVVALQYVALRWSGWRRSTPVTIAVGGVGLGVALAPVMLPFTVTRRELGFERSLNEVHDRSAEVLSYFDVRPNWLYRMKEAGYVYEATLFMGAVALGLALLGLLWLRRGRPAVRGWPDRVVSVGTIAAAVLLGRAVLIGITSGSAPPALSFTVVSVALLGLLVARQALDGWRRHQQGLVDRRLGPRDWVLILLGLSLVAFLLSLGPVVNVAGRPVGPGLYAWLQPYVLPLRALRAANRIGVLVVFAVSLLAALGVTWLRAHLPRRAFAPVMAVVGLLLLLEYATFPMSYGRVPALLRPVDVVLKGAPPDAVVLEWPTYAPMADADAMFRSIGHRKRVVNGYSGFVPQFLNKLSGLLTQPGPPFPVPAVEAYLRHIYPLELLVVRLTDADLAPPWRAAWRELRQAPPPFLHFHGSYGEEDLWDVSVGPERGVVAERWVSFEFIREHPVLRATLRPLLEDPELEQSARVSLNGRTIDQGRIDRGQPLTMTLTPPYHQAAFNVVTLAYRYRRAKALDDRYRVGTTRVLSSGDLRVQSAGQPYGESASIVFNGVELAPNTRGYNLAALTPDGRFHATGVFDTFFDPSAAGQLAAFIRSLPEGTLVAGAVRDEASGLLSDAAVAALRTLGVAGDLRGHFRESHAFIGVKGAAPGTALEELGPRALVLTVGQPPATIGFEIQSFALERAAGRR